MEKDKDHYLRMLAHQLKTPLSILELNLNMMQAIRESLHEKEVENFDRKMERIQRALKNMKNLVDSISIRESNYLYEPELAEIQLSDTMHQILSKPTSGSNLKFCIKNNLPPGVNNVSIPLKEGKFVFLIESLISNALIYSDDKNELIDISYSIVDQQFELTIKDKGIGIPFKELPEIGKPFYRAENARQIPGTGISLYLIKRLLAQVNGTFHIDSELNNSTTVFVSIPIKIIND